MPIKNILIDLGGVLYEIDIQSTIEKYRKMQAPDAEPVNFSKKGQHEYFSLLDCGQIEIDEFAQGLKDSYSLEGSIDEIKQIWLELLIGVIPGRIEQVKTLAQRYNLALLSNTGRFHRDFYYPQCKPMFDQMDYLFYSFEMGVRKPDSEIYEMALRETGWKAEETLFLDDSKNNIEAAQDLGIHTHWIETYDDFEEMMNIYAGKNVPS